MLFCICLINLLKFSKMSKYDMTVIGLNLREIPDGNGSFKLMVLGLLLDGPAYSAGVRQVSNIRVNLLTYCMSVLYMLMRKLLSPVFI